MQIFADITYEELTDAAGDWQTIEVVYPEGYSCIQTIVPTNNENKGNENIISETSEKLFTKSSIDRNDSVSTYNKRSRASLPCSEYMTQDGYQCPNCGRIYTARKNLVRHLNLECGKEPKFKCPYCLYKNHRRNELKKHMKNRHNIEVISKVINMFSSNQYSQ